MNPIVPKKNVFQLKYNSCFELMRDAPYRYNYRELLVLQSMQGLFLTFAGNIETCFFGEVIDTMRH